MGTTEQDWHDEQQRVELVTKKIGQRIQDLSEQVGRVKSEVVDIRRNFWDDVTINTSNMDDLVETYHAIRQQAEVLSERERRYEHAHASLKVLTRLLQSPYFGRVDFTETGESDTEEIYLGISSFKDEETGMFLIYDWRAPISSLYYDYGPGPVQYLAPAGEVTGQMTLKRQYGIRDGHVQFMFDTGLTIGDELLMQALGRHSDAQMKSIVATIQKEQNRVIRNDRARLLIVHGPAGSGKTSAALQRVAYLLYKNRQSLQASQVLLFSPNPLFNSYVSTVLPELGEENMQQTTFQDYLEHRLGEEFQLEDPFSQLEYVLTAVEDGEYATRMDGIRFKSSAVYLHAIQSYHQQLIHEGMQFLDVKFRNDVVISADLIKRQFYAYDPSIRFANRMEMLRDWLLHQLANIQEAEVHKGWVEDEIQFLGPAAYQRAYQKLKRLQSAEGPTFDDFDKEQELLASMVIEKEMKPVQTWIRAFQFADVLTLYRQLFTGEQLTSMTCVQDNEIPKSWPAICRQTLEKLDQGDLYYEDATPYLYLKELVQGLHAHTTVRHVFVDEAQDYTPFQFEFIKRLFPRSKMTILGDLNQAIHAHTSGLAQLDTLAQLYSAEQTEMIELQRSYRSTREIVEFTRAMVAGGADIVPFNRSGEKPVVTVVASDEAMHQGILNHIQSLQAEGYESIAVICKTANECAVAYDALSRSISLRLITKFSPSFEKDVLVIPAYLAKGVEFDAVIMYNASNLQYHRDCEHNLFYTACTRAMHWLHLYAVGEISPFVLHAPSDTYELETLPGK